MATICYPRDQRPVQFVDDPFRVRRSSDRLDGFSQICFPRDQRWL